MNAYHVTYQCRNIMTIAAHSKDEAIDKFYDTFDNKCDADVVVVDVEEAYEED